MDFMALLLPAEAILTNSFNTRFVTAGTVQVINPFKAGPTVLANIVFLLKLKEERGETFFLMNGCIAE
ncbi:hypothetical protein JCM5176_17680 [Streptococcus sobrinus]|uniref:Uncharacterized protein n=1 Tax=Streptococcus sobrinus W1703 TaxID=1227275 RepID=U2KK69_9STRE|nr:hypothetical protein HMPREF1557_00705 [Streptococcus sobrinus W1703]